MLQKGRRPKRRNMNSPWPLFLVSLDLDAFTVKKEYDIQIYAVAAFLTRLSALLLSGTQSPLLCIPFRFYILRSSTPMLRFLNIPFKSQRLRIQLLRRETSHKFLVYSVAERCSGSIVCSVQLAPNSVCWMRSWYATLVSFPVTLRLSKLAFNGILMVQHSIVQPGFGRDQSTVAGKHYP
jgi:hypothetical protein